jgi:hypothetical protein
MPKRKKWFLCLGFYHYVIVFDFNFKSLQVFCFGVHQWHFWVSDYFAVGYVILCVVSWAGYGVAFKFAF